MKYAIGVDVGGTAIKLGLVDEEGKMIVRDEIPTRKEDVDPMLYQDIKDAAEGLMNRAGIKRDEVIGIGIGVPGAVLSDGTVLGLTNIDIGVVNVDRIMEDVTGFPTRTANDANLAALGEMWQGGGLGYKDVVLLTLGTGVGGGVVIDGEVIFGINGAAGEIGHLPMVNPADEPDACGCGKHGCLEQYASATGVVRVARRAMEEFALQYGPDSAAPSPLYSANRLTAKVVFDAAKADDPLALIVVDRVCGFLGKGIAMACCITNPEAIILGGGMAAAGQIIIDYTKKYFQENVYYAAKDTSFHLAQLGNDAGIYGAAKLAMQNM